MKEWFLSLHPALLAVIVTLGFTLTFFARTQAKKHSGYSLFGLLWALITGSAGGVSLGLSFRLLYLLVI